MMHTLAALRPEQFTYSTPCAAYTVGDLIDHVDHAARLFIAIAHKGTSELPGNDADPVHVESNWFDVVSAHVETLGQSWSEPEAWAGSIELPGPDLSNAVWGNIALTEMVVHGWDIARATKQPFDLPQDTLQACLDHVAAFVPNAPIPALWGSPPEVAPEAPMIDRIVGITGRTPSWAPTSSVG
jgi:uncharacterized protein (TIGR03086 family)